MRPILTKTLPLLERAEAVGFLPIGQQLPASVKKSSDLLFYTGGSKGVIKVWDAHNGEVLWRSGEELEVKDDQEEQRQIVDVLSVLQRNGQF